MTARISDEDELVRLANNWLSVQAYYCLYHATQAVVVAAGHPRPDNHPKTQRMFADIWARRVVLAPWTLAVDAEGHHNVADGVSVDYDVRPLSLFNGAAAWSLACKALTTTRQSFVTEARSKRGEQKQRQLRNEWKAAEAERLRSGYRPRKEPRSTRPRLTAAERADVERTTRSATLIDYLYRLRIRTNYTDATMFTSGPSEASESKQVRWCLGAIAGTSLLLSEMAIIQRVGKSTVLGWAGRWKQDNVPSTLSVGLPARIPVLERFC
jgi:hypothetical protein